MNTPGRSRWRRIALTVLAAAALVALTHVLTVRWAAGELPAVRTQLHALESEVATLGRRLRASRSRRAQAEQHAEVTLQANRLLREEESARQAELQRLRAELDFYRRLAGSSGSQTGPAVYHLELEPSASSRVYRFVLTLTQNLRRSTVTEGEVTLNIEGTRDDRPVTLPWSLLVPSGAAPPSFRFRNFQQLDGYLSLPDRFTPLRLVVRLEVAGSDKPVTRGFDWQELLAGPGGDAR